MSLTEVTDVITQLGVAGVLALILFAGYKGWWVWGNQYQEKARECEEWKQLALKGINIADQVVRPTRQEP